MHLLDSFKAWLRALLAPYMKQLMLDLFPAEIDEFQKHLRELGSIAEARFDTAIGNQLNVAISGAQTAQHQLELFRESIYAGLDNKLKFYQELDIKLDILINKNPHLFPNLEVVYPKTTEGVPDAVKTAVSSAVLGREYPRPN